MLAQSMFNSMQEIFLGQGVEKGYQSTFLLKILSTIKAYLTNCCSWLKVFLRTKTECYSYFVPTSNGTSGSVTWPSVIFLLCKNIGRYFRKEGQGFSFGDLWVSFQTDFVWREVLFNNKRHEFERIDFFFFFSSLGKSTSLLSRI